MAELKLRECPFCGGKALLLQDRRTFAIAQQERFFVACVVCGVETPRIAKNRKQAADAWNRRVKDEAD